MIEEPTGSDLWERIETLLEEGSLDEARAEIERLEAERGDSAEVRVLAGLVRAGEGDVEGALSAMDDALALDPELEVARVEKARLLYDEERFEDALVALEGAVGAEARILTVSALYELGEYDEAKSVCERVLAEEEHSELQQLLALVRLQLADSEGALAAARRAVEIDPALPENHHAVGLALTQLLRFPEADRSFARAAELEPGAYLLPSRLSAEEFDAVVDEALAGLPPEFQGYLENVEVAIEDVPDPELVREGMEFDLLGLYQGGTIQSEAWGFPDRVLLFQRNLENISPDRATLIEEILDTVYHEIGHHMGMDEEAVRSAEEGED